MICKPEKLGLHFSGIDLFSGMQQQWGEGPVGGPG